MRLVFVGGLLDFINKPLCEEFYRILGKDFKFISLAKGTTLRKEYMTDFNSDVEYLVKGYDVQNQKEVDSLILNSDVVMFTSGLQKGALKRRLLSNSITFRITERLYKEPFTVKNAVHRFLSIIIHHKFYQQKSNFVLCNGAYVASDFNLFNCYRGRMFRWGYFTDTSSKSLNELLACKESNIVEICWVGRFVKLKHPEYVIEVAKSLKSHGKLFHVNMIGGGDEFETVQQKISDEHLEDFISLTGYLSHDAIAQYMDKSHIYLFTSDRNEGWGAVLLEAMGSACACVACDEAGSTGFVIDNNKNGLIFHSNNVEELISQVEILFDNSELRKSIAKNAYESIYNNWNAKTAASRLVFFCRNLLGNGDLDIYDSGPVSRV